MTRWPSEPIYGTAIVAGRALFGFWGLKHTVTGAAHVPATGGAVLASDCTPSAAEPEAMSGARG